MALRHLAVLTGLIGLCAALGAPPASGYLDARAAYGMALRYHQPLAGGIRDYHIALTLYCRADADDYGPAAHAIGLLYAAGHGVKRDDAAAAAWFRRAAALGHDDARAMLDIYRERRGAARCPYGMGRGATAAQRLRGPGEIRALVEKMAPNFDLDPKLVMAVIAVESSWQVKAVSSADARGLMQLIPATAERFGVLDVFDPADNLRGGMTYLRWLLTRFEGDVTLALAAYNAGEGAVARHGGVPPYRETQGYLRKIRELYPAETHP